MTVPEFLRKEGTDPKQVAKHCGVSLSQVYRWRKGESVPAGLALVRLVALSEGALKLADVVTEQRLRDDDEPEAVPKVDGDGKSAA